MSTKHKIRSERMARSVGVRRPAFKAGADFGGHMSLGPIAEAHIDPLVRQELADCRFAQDFHVHENIGLALALAHETKAAGTIEPFDLGSDPAAGSGHIDMRPARALH